jgi:hypothetical protein
MGMSIQEIEELDSHERYERIVELQGELEYAKLDLLLQIKIAETLTAQHTEMAVENERLRKSLRIIIERSPGQAHRIAIQALGA